MSNFPENSKDRETWIESQVLAGNFEARWCEITAVMYGKTIKLNVMDDALKVEGVRVNVSAQFAQKLADYFDASLPTAQIADLMYVSAVRKAVPCPQPISSTVSAMIRHSDAVGLQVGGGEGLAATVGKHWVLDKQLQGKPGQACNYGWHFTGSSFQGIVGSAACSQSTFAPGVRVIQPNATAHDMYHSDYSQICQLVQQTCWLDGIEWRFSDLLKDLVHAHMVSHQGPIMLDRQPGTTPIRGQYVMFPIVVTP